MRLGRDLPLPPADLVSEVEGILASLAPQDSKLFVLRLERWWDDLVDGLAVAYPEPHSLARRAVVLAARAYAERDEDLKTRDMRRVLAPDWFQRPDMVGYAAYTERFAGERGLRGVGERIDHLQALGVTYLHLMPLLTPRPGPNDGGYAVMDFRSVRSDLGTVEDLADLANRLHDGGISLCLDFVLNHVAREHEWAVRAKAGEQKYRDYFYIYPDRSEPDAYEVTLPEIFPDFSPGSFTWDDELNGWVWTSFNSYQWDLNWANPDVFAEMLGVILFLANLGVDVLRLDAIAFIWKRMGTDCQNQPEVHAITQALRAIVRMACPGVLFLAEAIVAPSDVVHYLGQRQHHGRLSDLAYHNSLMVQFWSMLASRDVRLAVQALRSMPEIPSSTAWLTYVRCHDDIGWAVEDRDAAAVGLSGFEHRAFLSDFYSGLFPGSFASGLVFQFNPDTGDRRISGAAASLAGFDRAMASGSIEQARDAVARVLLGYALVSFWAGIPLIWYGDEEATLNDNSWNNEPEHADDNRWVHRPRIDWDGAEHVGTTSEIPVDMAGSLVPPWPSPTPDPGTATRLTWHGLRRILAARKELPHLHASVPAEAMSTPDPGVLAVRRPHPLGVALGLFNVTESPRVVPSSWLYSRGVDLLYFVDAITGASPAQDDGGATVRLPAYGCVWLVARPGSA